MRASRRRTATAFKCRYDPALIVRIDAPVQGKVGLISGGGSGHEPMHGGFVGPGMLDAACPGEVFTSPTPDQMAAATKAVDGGAGVIHIVKNYTGDVMNFEMAAELAGAEGIEVETVLTNDDVAVEDSLYTAGRRGVGVTVILEKICGGAADDGKSLQEVAELGRRVNANGRSMGMALTPCITPAAGHPELRARRRRGRDRDRDPRRAGTLPREDRARLPGRGAADDADRRGPAVLLGRPRAGVHERDGRHAADRAVRDVRRGRQARHSMGSRSSAT